MIPTDSDGLGIRNVGLRTRMTEVHGANFLNRSVCCTHVETRPRRYTSSCQSPAEGVSVVLSFKVVGPGIQLEPLNAKLAAVDGVDQANAPARPGVCHGEGTSEASAPSNRDTDSYASGLSWIHSHGDGHIVIMGDSCGQSPDPIIPDEDRDLKGLFDSSVLEAVWGAGQIHAMMSKLSALAG